MPKYQCPECDSVLRRAEPIPEGKKIRCPKCEAVFPARAMAEAEEEPAASYALAGSGAPAKPKPAVDEEDDGTPYGVIKEDPNEAKPEVHLGSLRDRFAKSKIGPAMFKTVIPSNWLLRLGLFSCVVSVFWFGYALFPIVFCEATPLRPFIRPQVDLMFRATLMFTFGAIMCIGAARMHDLTSYAWAIIGSIMSLVIYIPAGIMTAFFVLIIFGPIGLIACLLDLALALVGLWCLIVLMQRDVREGFKERAEEIPV